ncbi:ROK family protein [Pelagimonas varians]|uniref:Beta-glucoside kinase n=1 Tax=Pelagimonas varians TaxID=696760 RepID=A0A238L569_9RHOB|nr:ROK family protein [Pelagimonas varians]PYG25506.1 putative NBD/HSP70 family sugar kinase [Pelagimonas varians]SMX50253.1 Beta-glucoside kinase [Pelagimonas varians]
MDMNILPSHSGSNAVRSRSSNRQAVLGRIQSAGQMGRAEIARSLGLSTQAVSNIIAELEEDGLLLEAGTRSGGRGLPAVQYSVNAEGGYALGVEIRPDAIFAALVDLHGNTIATRRRAIKNNKPDKLVAKVIKLRDEMVQKTGINAERLMGAGIVIPGPFGQTGLSGLGSDLAGWQSIDARTLFEDALGLPVELSNDANAAAMSERIAHGLSNFAYLYFGAGLGLGLVNQGQLVAGAFGNAGEIGHVQIMTAGGPAPLEQQLSRVSIQTFMRAQQPLDIDAISALFTQKDPRFWNWLEAAASALSQATGLIENLFDPQTIILGGAMPDAVLSHLIAQTHLPDLSVSNRTDNPIARLQCGTCGRMTATLGAASLILNRAFTPQAASL